MGELVLGTKVPKLVKEIEGSIKTYDSIWNRTYPKLHLTSKENFVNDNLNYIKGLKSFRKELHDPKSILYNTHKRVYNARKDLNKELIKIVGTNTALLTGAGYGVSKILDKPMNKKAEIVFNKLAEKKKEHTFKDMLTGALSGTIATTATMPLENIQITQVAQGPMRGKSFLQVAKSLAKEKNLWMGTGTKLLKVAPTMGLTFATYELLKDKL